MPAPLTSGGDPAHQTYLKNSSAIVKTGPNVEPVPETERGTMFDWLQGDLLFPYPADGQNLAEVTDWTAPTTLELLEMLDQDGNAQSMEKAITLPVRSASWKIEPASVAVTGQAASKQAEDIATDVSAMLKRESADGGMKIPLSTVIAQATLAKTVRRCYWEIVWKRNGGKLAFDKIAWRPPDTCRLLRDRDTGELRGFDQWVRGVPDRIMIQPPYSLVYIHGKERDPIKGRTDMSVSYKNYQTKEKIKFLWYTYLEGQSMPKVIAIASSDAQAKKLSAAIAAVRSAGVVAIPKEWLPDGAASIKTLDLSGKASADYQAAIAWCDSDSAKSLMAGFLDMEHRAGRGSSGAYNMHNDASSWFQRMLNADAIDLADTITDGLIGEYVRWNYGLTAPLPKFRFEDLNPDDVSQAAQLLGSIATAPQLNLPVEFIREVIMTVGRDMDMDMDTLSGSLDQWVQSYQQNTKTESDMKVAQLHALVAGGTAAVQAGKPVNPAGQSAAPPKVSVAGAALAAKPATVPPSGATTPPGQKAAASQAAQVHTQIAQAARNNALTKKAKP